MLKNVLKIIGLGFGLWSLSLIWPDFKPTLILFLVAGLMLALLSATGWLFRTRRYALRRLPVTKPNTVAAMSYQAMQSRLRHSLPTRPIHRLSRNPQTRHSQPTRPVQWA